MNYELIMLKNRCSDLEKAYSVKYTECFELKKIIENVVTYAKCHIEFYNNRINILVSQDKVNNKKYIDECKEKRERWRDIVRLCDGNIHELYFNIFDMDN